MSDDLPYAAHYFAYGSNMSTARLRERVADLRVVGPARIVGMRLRFNKLGRDGTGKANLVASPAHESWGVVFALAGRAIEVLDRYEPGYVRSLADVEHPGGARTRAQLYLASPSPPDLPPHQGYVEHLLTGAREHRLPEAVILALRTVAVRREPR